jgi:hypothetical protein
MTDVLFRPADLSGEEIFPTPTVALIRWSQLGGYASLGTWVHPDMGHNIADQTITFQEVDHRGFPRGARQTVRYSSFEYVGSSPLSTRSQLIR